MPTPARARLFATFPALAAVAVTSPALANHGPGTSGGGATTASGETLKAGNLALDYRFDWTSFRGVTEPEAARRATSSGEFDSLDNAFVHSFGLSYGLTDDWQLSIASGFYVGDHFVSAGAESPDEDPTVGTADPKGFTDTWFTTKLRVYHGEQGSLSFFGGVKAPTGHDDDLLTTGEPLEPSSQAGTGAVDFQLGAAYSRYLTPRVTLDASAAYVLRTKHDHFKVGDRADLGLALAYRLTEDVRRTPSLAAFGEVLAVWIGKDRESGEANDNSGGWTVYLSPGLRCRLTDHLSVTTAVLIPVAQELNGSQVKQDFRLSVGVTLLF